MGEPTRNNRRLVGGCALKQEDNSTIIFFSSWLFLVANHVRWSVVTEVPGSSKELGERARPREEAISRRRRLLCCMINMTTDRPIDRRLCTTMTINTYLSSDEKSRNKSSTRDVPLPCCCKKSVRMADPPLLLVDTGFRLHREGGGGRAPTAKKDNRGRARTSCSGRGSFLSCFVYGVPTRRLYMAHWEGLCRPLD